MKSIHSLIVIAMLGLFSPPAFSQTPVVIRGPYLQSPGPESIIVCWRTDVPSDSRVAYEMALTGPMSLFVDDSTVTTEHRVEITGLTPKTQYYYSIGNTQQTLKGPDSLMHFTTAPDPATPTPVRIWAIGDFGHGNVAEREVRDSYLRYAEAQRPADLWLWLGDNVYQDGTDQEYQTKVFDSINGYHHVFMNLPFASTSGNHDYNSICPWQDPNGIPILCNKDPYTHTGPYLDMIDPPTQGELGGIPSGLKLYYSFDYGDIHIVSLNSELGSLTPAYNWIGILNNDTSFTSPMLDWLKTDLAATNKKWKIVIWHQCPYSGQDNFTEENSVQQFCVATRHHFNPILERYGVDLVFTGHDHNYQRSYLINGHYGGKSSFTQNMMINGTSGKASLGEPYIKYTNGPLKGKGTVYVLQGNSSGGNSYSPISHPAIYWGQACDTCWGSFFADINGDSLHGYYLTHTDSIMDEFTIVKSQWTGIDEPQPLLGDLEVYPNPFHEQLTVSFHLNMANDVTLALQDLNGKTITEIEPGKLQKGSHSFTWPVEYDMLPRGLYILKLSGSSINAKRKIVKI